MQQKMSTMQTKAFDAVLEKHILEKITYNIV